MTTITIKTLEEKAAEVVAQVAAGETVFITDDGRPVVQMTPVPKSRLQHLVEIGEAWPPSIEFEDVPPPSPGSPLTEKLLQMREEERY